MEKISFNEFKNRFINEAVLSGKSNSYIDKYLEQAKKQIENQVPVILSADHLSKLSGVKIGYLYAVSNSDRSNFYKTFNLDKKNGGKRPISVPLPVLKILQTWILENIINNLRVSAYAKAYKKSSSLLDNAKYGATPCQVDN
ncbi:hypothetical protein [Levilactobacillus parabrevis]|uniref:hypothetical protein n=1 Tax=Levilactobacillus parabrevis TaxID=357278 RepID=UPI00375673A4